MDLFKVPNKRLYVSEDDEVVCGSYGYRDIPVQFFVTVHGKTFCFSDGFDSSEKDSYSNYDMSGKVIYYKFIVKSILEPLIVSPYQEVNFCGVLQKKFKSIEEEVYIIKLMEIFIKKYYKDAYKWHIDVDFELSDDVKRNIFKGIYLK